MYPIGQMCQNGSHWSVFVLTFPIGHNLRVNMVLIGQSLRCFPLVAIYVLIWLSLVSRCVEISHWSQLQYASSVGLNVSLGFSRYSSINLRELNDWTTFGLISILTENWCRRQY